MVKVKRVKKEVVGAAEYKATLLVYGRTCTATGASIIEAIKNLKPYLTKGKSILTLERGEKKQERVLPHIVTAGVFGPASGVVKEIRLKQISQRFDL